MRSDLAGTFAIGLLIFASLSSAARAQTAPSREPVAIEVAVVPPVLPADSSLHPALVISLIDANNLPTLPLSNVLVYLSSSNESVAVIPATATLPAGHAFVQVDVDTTASAGTATLAVASSGLSSGSVSVKTVLASSGPSSLSLFVSPPKSVRALEGQDVAYAVQLEGAKGNPAVSAANTKVVVTSSNGSLLRQPINVTIPAGSDLEYGQLSVGASGTATLTALAAKLATGSAQLSVAPVSRTLTVTFSPTQITNGDVASVQILVEVLGMPVVGANLTITVSLGAVVPSALTTDSRGQASAKYISEAPGPATVSVLATASHLGVFSGSNTLIVTSLTSTESTSGPGSMLWVYVPVVVIVMVIALAFLVVRRTLRKRTTTVEEDSGEPDAARP